jgi:MFS family permease
VYQVESARQAFSVRRAFASACVSRTVLFLGITSLLTDISSEMVTAILPLYLVVNLNLSPFIFGVLDGVYLGATTVVRPISGYLADRVRRLKEVAFAGYALSAASRLGLLAVGSSASAIGGMILLDRLGKGIRTSPRDAMISLSTPTQELATAFGVHRAMDTAGAMLGPLFAFGILILAPDAYDAVFVVSFCFALMGLSVIGLYVHHRPTRAEDAQRAVALRGLLVLFVAPGFQPLLIVGFLLGLSTISDGFLYLTLQRRLDFHVGFFPLLFVATALVYMVLALPIGRLADRIGRARVFLAGYGLLGLAYTSLLLPSSGAAEAILYVVLIGAYYAATDGVLMAVASPALPENLRASGLALLTTATSLGRSIASVLFGLLWTWQGVETAVIAFAASLIVALTVSAVVLSFRGSAITNVGASERGS